MVKKSSYINIAIFGMILLLLCAISISIVHAYPKQKMIEKPFEVFSQKAPPIYPAGFSLAAVDSYPSDDNYTTATWITTDATKQEHSFDPVAESDWIKFNATENKTYIITTQNTSAATDTYMRLYYTDGDSVIGTNDDINSSTYSSQIIWFAQENGTYYVELVDLFSAGGTYNLTVNETVYIPATDGGDTYESDNWYKDAKTILTNETSQSHTFEYFTNDKDYVNFSVTADQIYVVENFATTSSTDTFLKLFENDGTTFVSQSDDLGYPYNNNSRIIFKPTTTTYYYAEVWDRLAAGGNYTLDIYNATTTNIQVNGTPVEMNFTTTGGVQFVNFTAINGTVYTISTQNTSAATDTYIFLYDENMTLLRENDDNYLGGTFASSLSWYASESYNGTMMYVASSDSYSQTGTFNFTVTNTTTITGDSYESDGHSSLANWIFTNGTEQTHSFNPVGEEDWIKFNATEGDIYVIETANTTSDVDTKINLYYENGTLLDSNDDIVVTTNTDSRITLNTTENGTYTVQILDIYAHGGNYTISVTKNGVVYATITSHGDENNVTRFATFEITVNLTCNDGSCGNVTAILDPKKQKQTQDKEEFEQVKIKEKIEKIESQTTSSEKSTYIIHLKDTSSFRTSSFTTLAQKKQNIKTAQDSFITKLSDDINIKNRYKTINAMALELTQEQLDELKNNPDVIDIEESKKFHLTLDDAVPQVNTSAVWNTKTDAGINITGAGQTVCIIDSGVNYTHTSLSASYLGGYDFCNGVNCATQDSDPMDETGHGTHVAGIVVSNDSTNKGVAPDAGYVAMKIFNSTIDATTTTAAIVAAIDWCVDNQSVYNISVISMSLGDGTQYNSACDASYSSFTSAINTATTAGISVVVASGNEGHISGINSPACIANAISVGSVTKSDIVSSFTNAGSILDLLAPGSSINSTSLKGGAYDCSQNTQEFGVCSGTSMATPLVSGSILLLNQFNRAKLGSDLTKTQALDYLNDTGVQINDTLGSTLNFSRIDIYSALLQIESDTSKGVIPMNSGVPFFTTSQNPRYPENLSCLQDMEIGDYCEITWIVNATGATDSKWDFFVDVNYSFAGLSDTNQSNNINITISSEDEAPQIIIEAPTDSGSYDASNIWVNATINSTTSLISVAQYRLENSTWSGTYTSLTSGSNDLWYASFDSSGLEAGDYAVRIYANNSAGTNNQSFVNITIDNAFPQITIQTTYPQYTNTPLLNYTITEVSKNTTWYNLDEQGVIITNNTGASSINTTLTLVHPGMHNITIYANDSFGNENSTNLIFYESFLMNVSKWTTETLTEVTEATAIKLFNVTGEITDEETVEINTTVNLTIETTNFNTTVLNFPGQNASWSAATTFDVSETNTNITNTFINSGTNTSRILAVYNMSNLISESLYNTSLTLYYCDENEINAVSDCTAISACSGGFTGTTCYTQTASTTTVYASSFSTLVVESDTIVPTITFNSPRNSSAYTANSETYNITINVTTSEDATGCDYSFNGGTTNVSMTNQAGTDNYIEYITKANAAYTLTVFCTDDTNTNTSIRYFTINDVTDPSLEVDAIDIGENDATIETTTDEPVYGVVFYAKGSSADDYVEDVDEADCQAWTNDSSSDDIDDRWRDNWKRGSSFCDDDDDCEVEVITKSNIEQSIEFDISSLTDTKTHYYGVCVCDNNENCEIENINLDFITDTPSGSSGDGDSGGGGGGGNESTSTTTVKTFTAIWDSVLPNTETNWALASSSISISNLKFKVSNFVQTITIVMSSLGPDSSATGLVAAPNNVYDYLRVTSTAGSTLYSAEFTFKIPKSWFTTNGYDESKVRLYRYVNSGSTGEWTSIFTTIVETEGSEYTYKATSSGFSFFAITAPKAPPTIIPDTAAGETLASKESQELLTITETMEIDCGDNICDANETCLTCSKDCGDCNVTGTSFFSNLGGFIKLYWIYMTISALIIMASIVFFFLMAKESPKEKAIEVYQNIKNGAFNLLPQRQVRKKTTKFTNKKTQKTFELGLSKKTQQTKLSLAKKKAQQMKKETPKQPKKLFKIFNKGKKRQDVEELKREPGVFKLK